MPPLQSKDPQLFVHLAWETHSDSPTLQDRQDDQDEQDDQFQQAVHTAVRVRLRCLCCHLMALNATSGKIHFVARFPASLSVSIIARTSYAAATEATTLLHEIIHATKINPATLWSQQYAAQTLAKMNTAQAKAYLNR